MSRDDPNLRAQRRRILLRKAKENHVRVGAGLSSEQLAELCRQRELNHAERELRERREAEDALLQRRDHLWRQARVPKRHALALRTCDWVSRSAEIERSDAVIANGGILSIIGPVGTGKTQLATRLIECCCRAGRSARFTLLADLLDDVRRESYDEGKSEARVIRGLVRGLHLLVIDEIDLRRWTDDESLWFERLLNARYNEMLPTVLIANLTAERLATALGPRVLDRMREGGAVIELLGETMRRRREVRRRAPAPAQGGV